MLKSKAIFYELLAECEINSSIAIQHLTHSNIYLFNYAMFFCKFMQKLQYLFNISQFLSDVREGLRGFGNMLCRTAKVFNARGNLL